MKSRSAAMAALRVNLLGEPVALAATQLEVMAAPAAPAATVATLMAAAPLVAMAVLEFCLVMAVLRAVTAARRSEEMALSEERAATVASEAR